MKLALLVPVAVVLAACAKPQPPDAKAMAEGQYLAGTAAYLQGKYPEARQRFEEVRKLNPEDPRLPAALGELALTEGKLSEALTEYREATRKNPTRALNWSRLGGLLAATGERAEATAALEKALGLNPKDSDAHEQLATLRLKAGAFEEASAGFLRAAELAPAAQQDGVILAGAAALQKAEQASMARSLLEKAVGAGKRGSELWAELGDLRVRAGELEQGREAYENAARGGATDPTLWEVVGELNVRLDKPADAEAAFRESLRLKDRAVIHLALARLALARKDAVTVKTELDLALAGATGEDPRESGELAQLLEQVGRPADALRLLRALAEDPAMQSDPALWQRIAKLSRATGDKAGEKAACAAGRDAGLMRCP